MRTVNYSSPEGAHVCGRDGGKHHFHGYLIYLPFDHEKTKRLLQTAVLV